MTDEENLSRLEITDPSSRRPAESAVEEELEKEVGEEAEDDSQEPKDERKPAKGGRSEPEDLDEYLDEVAGKRIAELTRKIEELESRMAKPPEREEPRQARREPQKAEPPQAEKVARRQSQFVSRTSGRDGSALSPEERATRSVEELMRKRGLL